MPVATAAGEVVATGGAEGADGSGSAPPSAGLHDAIVGVVFGCLALVFGFQALNLPGKAALYPRIVVVILGALSLALIARGIVHGLTGGRRRSTRLIRPTGAVKFALVLATSLGYVLIFRYIEFRVALFVFIIVSLPLWGLRWAWWKQLLTAVAITLSIYYAFGVFFSVPLP